jgi:predicted nuclease of predicted toxin-antitoxin system
VVEMRILLDEHYTGLKEYLEALGWDVTTVQDAKLKGAKDREIVEYARENDLLVVTEDDRPAQIADMLGVKYIWISPGVVAKTIDAEIREKYAGD